MNSWLSVWALFFAFLLSWSLAVEAAQTGDKTKGKKVFESHLCAECHKGGGNSVRPSKPIKGKAFAAKYSSDSDLVKVIRQGVPDSSMPSFASDVIDDMQMTDLVAYIRSLTPGSSRKTPPGPKTKKSDKKENRK